MDLRTDSFWLIIRTRLNLHCLSIVQYTNSINRNSLPICVIYFYLRKSLATFNYKTDSVMVMAAVSITIIKKNVFLSSLSGFTKLPVVLYLTYSRFYNKVIPADQFVTKTYTFTICLCLRQKDRLSFSCSRSLVEDRDVFQ